MAARDLPRRPATSDLANKVVAAAEREETAIRGLRDTWEPDQPLLFANVDVERSTASALLKQVEDDLAVLRSKTSAVTRAKVDGFSRALQTLNDDWDAFHESYDSFRRENAQLDSAETTFRFGELIDSLRGIVVGVRELPAVEVAEKVSAIVSQAVEAEDLALRVLRSAFEGASPTGPNTVGTTTLVSLDPEALKAFDAELVKSNSARRQAVTELAMVSREISEEGQVAVEDFTEQYVLAISTWEGVHRAYDEWRESEGGCDRAGAVETLGRFVQRFGDLAGSVRALPRATFLQPLGELLVEAAEAEEASLRALRNTWRPFDSEVYATLDGQRVTSLRLRRQVATGIQELLPRFDISLDDLK